MHARRRSKRACSRASLSLELELELMTSCTRSRLQPARSDYVLSAAERFDRDYCTQHDFFFCCVVFADDAAAAGAACTGFGSGSGSGGFSHSFLA